MKRAGVVVASLVSLALLAPASAFAIQVNRTDNLPDLVPADAACDVDAVAVGDQCTLRAAVETAEQAAGADAIDFADGLGTILLDTNEVPEITQNLTITGPGAGLLTIEGQQQAQWIFRTHLTSAPSVRISGLTIKGGRHVGTGNPLQAVDAGGVHNQSGEMILERVVVTGNSSSAGTTFAIASGGGISNEGKMEIRDSTVSGNSASGTGSGPNPSATAQGAGIYNETFGPNESLLIQRSTISGNNLSATIPSGTGNATAFAEGAGILNVPDSDLTLDRVTVSGNNASAVIGSSTGLPGPSVASGGGLQDDSDAIVQSSTLTANSVFASGNGPPAASASGANLGEGAAASTQIHNSILAAPLGGTNCSAPGGASSFSIESPNDTCGLAGTGDRVSVTAAALNLDPALADNGAPTRTHALLAGSIAIDQGKANASLALGEATDQRGFGRPSNFAGIADATGGDGSDVGAFELQAPAPPAPPQAAPVTTSPAAAATENPECATLREKLKRLNRKIKRADDREKKAKLKKQRRKVRRKLTQLGCAT